MSVKLNSRGDTIVEVLIAITVVSSVLAVAFSTMNRNLSITRENQERTEASKIAQGQIEALKAVRGKGTPAVPAVGTAFCISNDGSTINTSIVAGTPNALNVEADVFADYGTCRSGFYHYAIVRVSANSYRFYVRWDAFAGKVRSQIIMAYRI